MARRASDDLGREFRAPRDDWHRRHARTSPPDREETRVVSVRRPVWERDWHARHGHVARLGEE